MAKIRKSLLQILQEATVNIILKKTLRTFNAEKKYCVAICHVYYNICRVRDKNFESKMEGVFMMVRKLLKAAIYIKVIVVTTLVTMQEPMADEVMDEFVTSEIMEEETLAI